jgi:hypothetical protein
VVLKGKGAAELSDQMLPLYHEVLRALGGHHLVFIFNGSLVAFEIRMFV